MTNQSLADGAASPAPPSKTDAASVTPQATVAATDSSSAATPSSGGAGEPLNPNGVKGGHDLSHPA
jgi:hypothetical protein